MELSYEAKRKLAEIIVSQLIEKWDASKDDQMKRAAKHRDHYSYVGECLARLAIDAVEQIEKGVAEKIDMKWPDNPLDTLPAIP
jgi:hypothetical protein